MAHIWKRQRDGEWVAAPPAAPPPSAHPPDDTPDPIRILRAKSSASDQPEWVCLAGRGVTINGERLVTGARVLADRDEIVMPEGERVYFSTESKAEIQPLPHGLGEVFCARCKKTIDPGSPAVACPQCGSWHHQTEELGCWNYIEKCSLCPQATALDADFQFNPGDL